MPQLVISKDEKVFFRIPVNTHRFTIGRSSTNDLTLPDEEVSRRHAEIFWDTNAYWIKNLSSTTGTYIHSQKIEQSPLKYGQPFQIASWNLIFEESQNQDHDAHTTQVPSDSETKILRLDPVKDTAFRSHYELIDSTTGQKYSVAKTPFIIGSAAECDLVLKDEYVSAKHCRLIREGDAFVLEDLGSTNGTLVRDVKISKTPLSEGVDIVLGQTQLRFAGRETEESITPAQEEIFCGLVGKSLPMRSLFSKIKLCAGSDNTVLIQAESGCGKELVAQALHQLSPRNKNPYIILNCGAISPQLIESELFGHEKGAFTGAVSRRLGAFELAHHGTLFLDEIGEMPLDLQPKLLRALENRNIRRVGGDAETPVDVRVIAATNRNLSECVKAKTFREDLFFRLYVLPLNIPPLRDRREDIPLLVDFFIRQAESSMPSERRKKFSRQAMEKLLSYSWPGNVREIKNVIFRSLIFCEGPIIQPEHVELLGDPLPVAASQLNLVDAEKNKIVDALKMTAGNKAKAAVLLGIAKSTLFKKLKEYDLADKESEE